MHGCTHMPGEPCAKPSDKSNMIHPPCFVLGSQTKDVLLGQPVSDVHPRGAPKQATRSTTTTADMGCGMARPRSMPITVPILSLHFGASARMRGTLAYQSCVGVLQDNGCALQLSQ